MQAWAKYEFHGRLQCSFCAACRSSGEWHLQGIFATGSRAEVATGASTQNGGDHTLSRPLGHAQQNLACPSQLLEGAIFKTPNLYPSTATYCQASTCLAEWRFSPLHLPIEVLHIACAHCKKSQNIIILGFIGLVDLAVRTAS